MATRGHLKAVEFKQAVLAAPSATLAPESPSTSILAGDSSAVVKSVTAATTNSAATPTSPVTAVAAMGAPTSPRFTGEETILLRGLASGASSKEMAAQMRLPRETLYRLIGDLRRKTGATSDTALAVWVLRHMSSGAGERRGGGR